MTLSIPLTVRLSNSRTDRHIERDLRSLRFRSVAPGGFASAQFSLDRPLASSPDELAYYTDVDIYDARNGNCVWCGRLEDPGRGVGSDGQVWDLAAVGPSAHAQDRTVPLVFIDRNLGGWFRANVSPTIRGSLAINGSATTDPNDDDTPALVFFWPDGQFFAGTAEARMRYNQLYLCGQKLAAYDFSWDAGLTAADLHIASISREWGVGGLPAANTDQTWSTAGGSPASQEVVSDFPNGDNTIELQTYYSGTGATVSDTVHWLSVTGIYVKAMLYNADGTERTTSYTGGTYLASDIVNDLLGRLLTEYDGANASVAATSYAIDHLAYPDGVTAAQVLEDLMMLEPAYYWAAWDRTAGGYRFEWRTWPTTVRYEADLSDGYSSTGSADGLYNAVTVRWRGPGNRINRTRRTQTVPELTAVGLTREGFLDLGDEVSSSANAVRAGDEFLSEHTAALNAGSLTVARPIYDHDRGRRVMPWEIRPGHLIRVRGIAPRPDSLNVTDRDGVTVFRIVGVDYDTGSAAASLELDSYPPSVARALAETKKRRVARRR